MLKKLSISYLVAAMGIATLSITSYAGSHTEVIKLPCPIDGGEPTELTRPAEPRTQYTVTLNGIHADSKGYAHGMLTKVSEDFTYQERQPLSEAERAVLRKITPYVKAICIGSGKEKKLKLKPQSPEMATFACDKGDGLLVEVYSPEAKDADTAQVTLTTTRDDEEGSTLVNTTQKVNVHQDMGLGYGAPSAAAASSSVHSGATGGSGGGHCALL